MLEQVLLSLRNWFVADKRTGRVRIEDGRLVPPAALGLKEGQYVRITGSTFNDGLHAWPYNDLTDEEFVGTVWALAIPQTVVDLADEDRRRGRQSTPRSWTARMRARASAATATPASAATARPSRGGSSSRRVSTLGESCEPPVRTHGGGVREARRKDRA